MEYEDGHENLSSLIDWANKNNDERSRNEATTRLHLIDRLFFECLGWERGDCVAEERLNGEYIDYSFRCPQCLLIVEAKKEGIYFELPVGTSIQKKTSGFSRTISLKCTKRLGKRLATAKITVLHMARCAMVIN